MNILDNIAIWWEGLLRRRRLSLLNTRDNQEVWHTHISPMNIIMALISTLLVLFIVVLTLVGYTPILDLLPGYSAEVHRSRQHIIDNIVKLDSMDRIINDMMIYTDNISLIMEGKTPVVRTKSSADGRPISKSLVQPNSADSALRRQMEGEGRYNLRAAMAISTTPIVAPADGVITRHFDLSDESYGVQIATSAEQRVMAVQDGVVTLAIWSPENGYTIQVLHSNNLLSIYQNIPHTTITRGDMVKSGEVIGYNGEVITEGIDNGLTPSTNASPSTPRREICFELWRDGKPIDPERYIIF